VVIFSFVCYDDTINRGLNYVQKYMDKYLELSKEFKETNESQKTIKKIYEFINELEKEENIDDKIILVNIYALLKHHQKAYTIYKNI
jgi:hypothetical protein